jgi:hypothetical protein
MSDRFEVVKRSTPLESLNGSDANGNDGNDDNHRPAISRDVEGRQIDVSTQQAAAADEKAADVSPAAWGRGWLSWAMQLVGVRLF